MFTKEFWWVVKEGIELLYWNIMWPANLVARCICSTMSKMQWTLDKFNTLYKIYICQTCHMLIFISIIFWVSSNWSLELNCLFIRMLYFEQCHVHKTQNAHVCIIGKQYSLHWSVASGRWSLIGRLESAQSRTVNTLLLKQSVVFRLGCIYVENWK